MRVLNDRETRLGRRGAACGGLVPVIHALQVCGRRASAPQPDVFYQFQPVLPDPAVRLRRVNIRTKSILLVPLSATLIVLTGCGDDDAKSSANSDPKPSASRTDSGTPTESSAAPTIDPADKKVAEAALLELSDFPVGWESAPADKSDKDDKAGQRDIAKCMGVDVEALYPQVSAKAESPEFTSEEDETVSVNVTVDPTDETTIARFELGATDKFRECSADLVVKSMKETFDEVESEGAEVGEVTLNAVSVGSFGDETVAFRMTIPYSYGGFNAEVTGTFVIVRVGRAQTSVSDLQISGGMSTEELTEYVDKATKRLQAALATTS